MLIKKCCNIVLVRRKDKLILVILVIHYVEPPHEDECKDNKYAQNTI